ncbi:MAG: fused MFS/spermidine synthase [Candidatus Pacearchaeota archaeon]
MIEMEISLRKLLLVAFVFSGAAALIYQVTWIRPLQFVFGSTTYTISIILAAFMGGLALGSWWISKHVDEIKNLPRAYGLMEIGIGLYGVLLLSIFNMLPGVYNSLYFLHGNFYIFMFVQLLLVFLVLLIPTALMGATFPVVAKYYTKTIGKGIGEVYSANNIGAIFGSFAAGFILIPLFGIKASIIFASSINILIGSIIIWKSDEDKSSEIKNG